MRIYSLRKSQLIKASLIDAWAFFSSPQNLVKITPGYMKFSLVDHLQHEPIYEGMIIRYTVRPLLNIPVNWVTEITHIEHQKRFIDEQRFGPYKFWHHQHHFKTDKSGVLMEDIVHYALGFSWIGKIANNILVRKKLEEIFEYRSRMINQYFNN